jgi:hypothetical protein
MAGKPELVIVPANDANRHESNPKSQYCVSNMVFAVVFIRAIGVISGQTKTRDSARE